jgi:hypothetical protein
LCDISKTFFRRRKENYLNEYLPSGC